MDAPILSRTGPGDERLPDPCGPEGDHGLLQRLPEPVLTLQMVEAAIRRQHVVEDEAERIFAQAQNLLASVKVERARLLDEIAHLRDDLSETRALLRQTCRDLAAAEHRADLAEHRVQDLAARNDAMAHFCARLVDAVEPMMDP
ncbi:MAG: hypothetical protein INR63_07910 [Actinomycetospora chiangmaiensis]|nr:hypothetical protein [Actinomycetospora chiangmaiensis]